MKWTDLRLIFRLFVSDRTMIEELMKESSYEGYGKAFLRYHLYGCHQKDRLMYPRKKDRVKALREEVKKAIKDLTNQFFFQSAEEMYNDLKSVSGGNGGIIQSYPGFYGSFCS